MRLVLIHQVRQLAVLIHLRHERGIERLVDTENRPPPGRQVRVVEHGLNCERRPRVDAESVEVGVPVRRCWEHSPFLLDKREHPMERNRLMLLL